MLRPDDVQALDDSERAKYAKLEQYIDKELVSTRGTVSFRLPKGLWRIVYRISRSYADQGWMVRLRKVNSTSGDYILNVDHPSIYLPNDLYINESVRDLRDLTGRLNEEVDLVPADAALE